MQKKNKKKIVNTFCCFIPIRKLRHKIRNLAFGIKIQTIHEKNNFLLTQIVKKLSFVDNIFYLKNVKFFIPNYPYDSIQSCIVDNMEFFEEENLKELNQYLNHNSVVFDIGANIGNHTLYWSKITNVKEIHSFEPVPQTFAILKKNIEINNLNGKVRINNVGLGASSMSASFNDGYNYINIGACGLKENSEGGMKIISLDEYIKENFQGDKIDFLKIDVENFEISVLNGAQETLREYKPIIFIESFKEYFEEVNNILTSIGYTRIKDFPESNYLYKFI